MFSRLTKFRKTDEYEDLDGLAGVDKVEMDITDPAMRRYAGMGDSEAPEGDNVMQVDGEPEGIVFIL